MDTKLMKWIIWLLQFDIFISFGNLKKVGTGAFKIIVKRGKDSLG